jgi:hypothetical protein
VLTLAYHAVEGAGALWLDGPPLHGTVQIVKVERFGQAVVDWQVGHHLLSDHSGHHDNGNIRGRRVRVEPPADFLSVHARHHDVQQDQVRVLVVGNLKKAFQNRS